MWDSFVELLRATIFSAAHLCGGSLGGGVFLVSAGLRLALLPLTLRIARRARDQQARIAALGPEIETLKRRYASDPRALMRETNALYATHGIKLMTPSGLAGAAIQLPLLSGLFAAVRRGLGSNVRCLWVHDLALPDTLLVLGVALATALGVASTPAVSGRGSSSAAMIIATVLGTMFFLWSASSAVALSMGAGSLVSLLQNWMLSRDARVRPSPTPV
jgi:membrane protein insertase Oxa1/YidC/SpoIIIJ